jgi:hypothetical protein
MEQEVSGKLNELDAKLNAIYASVEKTRKYLLIMVWVAIAVVVLPAIGLIFAIPAFINTYTSSLDGLI